MTQPNLPNSDYFARILAELKGRLTNLETQQQFIVADATGTRVIQIGVFPGSPVTYGLKVWDDDDNVRVQIGELSNGDYGILLEDALTGQTTELLPVYEDGVETVEGTSSTTYTDLSTPGPGVTATVGASGVVDISVNCYVGIPGGSGSVQSLGAVGITIDGAPISGVLNECIYFANTVTGPDAVGMASNQSFRGTITGLAPGVTHTFEMKYRMSGPGTVNFGNRFLLVEPR